MARNHVKVVGLLFGQKFSFDFVVRVRQDLRDDVIVDVGRDAEVQQGQKLADKNVIFQKHPELDKNEYNYFVHTP